MEQLLETKLADTEITGLLGNPVEHSLSPVMHNRAFQELGLNNLYLPWAVKEDKLAQAIAGIRGLDITGVNLTIPHKQQVLPHLDKLSEEAKLIGAVNTIENQAGKLIGHNTDGRGYLRSLQEEADFNPVAKKVLVVGAGGAARAVAFQLALAGVSELYIANRTVKKARLLIEEINKQLEVTGKAIALSKEKLAEKMERVDLVVDTTPVGMYPQTEVKPVIPADLLHSDLLVSDLVYNPQETVLLQAAKKKGAATLSGLGMLLYQGVIAFEIWTGKKAPVKVMREALEKGLKRNT